MVFVLVLALGATGAMLAANDRGRLAARGVPPGLRLLYGGAAGAAVGLVLVPVLGLVAALLFFGVGLAALAAIALGVALLARAARGRWG